MEYKDEAEELQEFHISLKELLEFVDEAQYPCHSIDKGQPAININNNDT